MTCFDPDAPIVSGFWHWVAVDIPADVTSWLPVPARATTPCPATPSTSATTAAARTSWAPLPRRATRSHRYFFVVHAVGEETLGVDASASPAVVGFNLAFKTLGRAILHGT